jgi:hypothetical protein
MSTVSRDLPPRPHLDVPKREARALLSAWRNADPDALARIRRRHPRFQDLPDAEVARGKFLLNDAQRVIAREYGLEHWTELKQRITSHSLLQRLDAAIRADARAEVVAILQANPELMHVPVRSGNWGPPMSHAANLGRLEIVQAVAALGARDFQHALDRALLQGQLHCARWLCEQGAKLAPGILMGSCETLNASGFRFLVEANAPLTDAQGDPLAPLGLVLGTYCRNPPGKHEILEHFARLGHRFPETPIMDFHAGRVDELRTRLRRDPGLVHRRFSRREIYPPELGCPDHDQAGLHGTPIAGTTLLHLAIDFDEQEIFDMLLAEGADVNATADVDAEGFGGQTPLFHGVVSCAVCNGRQRDASMARALLDRGASRDVRASVRKFLDWQAEPGWHVARDVTAEEWGRGFPHPNWVNHEALRLLTT